jgi:hypothetical protein
MSREPGFAGEATSSQPVGLDLSEEDEAAKLGEFA